MKNAENQAARGMSRQRTAQCVFGHPFSKEEIVSYARFGIIVFVSTVTMFALMYLNSWSLDHVFYSQTRTWMALVMGATMATIMLIFMWGMYGNTNANIAILAICVVVFGLSLWLVRSQETVSDISYMEAMIPHHSIAVMTSDRAHIRDPRVRKLADGILEAQVREIKEMQNLITDLRRNPTPSGATDLPPKDVGQ
jgi:hypothetical protein